MTNPGRGLRWMLPVAVAVLAMVAAPLWAQGPERWEKHMKAFEAADREKPPVQEGIVFIGSSSIVKWDLDKWFPGMNLVNRGFGGSQMADSVYYADRILIPLRPKTVVVYAGDNDINAGKSAKTVVKDYRAFVAKVHGTLPETRILYIAIKPSLKRWKLVGEMRKANAMIREIAAGDGRLEFVDIDAPMIGADGKPRAELFVEDGLHLSDKGYEVWTGVVKELLQ